MRVKNYDKNALNRLGDKNINIFNTNFGANVEKMLSKGCILCESSQFYLLFFYP